MKRSTQKQLFLAAIFLGAFVLWTAAVCLVDVRAIGPEATQVGFATWNRWFHTLTGVHLPLYVLTDWLGLVPVFTGFGFALLGLVQWMRRKRLCRVDRSILVLGGFYLLTLAAYLGFEAHVVNYRPILIEGRLEASYPSSTTLLVLCVMPTALLQLRSRIRKRGLKRAVTVSIAAFMVFMVVGRLVSGVHWCSDILGGILLSAGLVAAYRAAAKC